MKPQEFIFSVRRFAAAFILLSAFAAVGIAQTDTELKETTVKALTLLNEGKYREAEPELAKLIQWMPDVANLRVMYGTVLVIKSKQIDNNEEAKKASALALVQFQEAKRLGSDSPEVDTMIKLLGGGEASGGTAKGVPPHLLSNKRKSNLPSPSMTRRLCFTKRHLKKIQRTTTPRSTRPTV